MVTDCFCVLQVLVSYGFCGFLGSDELELMFRHLTSTFGRG